MDMAKEAKSKAMQFLETRQKLRNLEKVASNKVMNAVAVLTLGFVPIIIPYPARIATSIECQEVGEISFTTN